jgi:hypothetical protein
LAILFGLTVGYAVVAVWLFNRVVHNTRRSGRLVLD